MFLFKDCEISGFAKKQAHLMTYFTKLISTFLTKYVIKKTKRLYVYKIFNVII